MWHQGTGLLSFSLPGKNNVKIAVDKNTVKIECYERTLSLKTGVIVV